MQWDAIEGASKYAIAEYIDGKYKNYSVDWKDTTYTISGLANGYQHTFLVQANINGRWSAFSSSNYVTATPQGTMKPTAQIVSTTFDSVSLEWNAVPGATKYAIAIQQADGSFKNYDVNYRGTSYTIDGLESETNYKILVQANINGRWSAFSDSDLVEAKTKRG